VKRPQGCVDEGSEFISEILGGILLFSLEVQGNHRSHARCAHADRDLRTYQLRLRD
jgi:hypothetical protein